MTGPKRPRGRPRGWRADDPRDKMLRVKLTADEQAAIQRLAREAGETVSEYVRIATKARAVGLVTRHPTSDDEWPR